MNDTLGVRGSAFAARRSTTVCDRFDFTTAGTPSPAALAGFAWFDPPNSGDIQCDPDADRGALEPQMLDWLEARSRSEGSKDLVVRGFDADASIGSSSPEFAGMSERVT
ncbi:MAG: hypothetical protein VCE43_12545, partial [Myxococcota bacterium]